MLLNRLLLALSVLAVSLLSAESLAQFGTVARPSGGDAAKSSGGMMGNSPLTLINDQRVVEELELVDDQVKALQDLQNDMREVFRQSFSGMRDKFRDQDVDREALMSEIREMIQSKLGTVETALTKILLPHQKTRLDELHFQMQANRSGTIGLLNNPKIKERLGLTDEEIEALEEKFDEVRGATERKIKTIHKEAKEKILSEFTSEQRAKIKEILGDKFEFGESGLRGDHNGH